MVREFESLDITCFWHSTDRITVKAKARNVLGEGVTIERNGAVTFEEDPGTTIMLSFSWTM